MCNGPEKYLRIKQEKIKSFESPSNLNSDEIEIHRK